MSFVPGTRGDSPYYITGGTSREVAYTCKDRFVYINKIRVVDSSASTPTITIEYYSSIDNRYVLLTQQQEVPPHNGLELTFEPMKLYRNDNITVTCSGPEQHILIQTMVDGQPKAD